MALTFCGKKMEVGASVSYGHISSLISNASFDMYYIWIIFIFRVLHQENLCKHLTHWWIMKVSLGIFVYDIESYGKYGVTINVLRSELCQYCNHFVI